MTGPETSTAVTTTPVRIADVGGWTDTWFGGPGRVCSLAAGPGVTVEASLEPHSPGTDRTTTGGEALADAHRVHLIAADLGEDYRYLTPSAGQTDRPLPGRQPLLEHAVASGLEERPVTTGHVVVIRLFSAIPAGASLGTSAAAVVGILRTLGLLLDGTEPSAEGLAAAAHRVETVRARRHSGVQDQWASAFGGAALLRIDAYPRVQRSTLELSIETRTELEQRLVTVFLGAHDSSQVHADVIGRIGDPTDPMTPARMRLGELSRLAVEAARALAQGDVDNWAGLLTAATETQRALHPGLVGRAHQSAIDIAEASGCAGWKVNGAGGNGGSLTIVAADGVARQRLAERLAERWQVMDLSLVPERREPTGGGDRGPVTDDRGRSPA